jgi:hypothetical protein
VGAYAVQDNFGKVFTLLFNKSLNDEPVHVTVADSLVGAIQLYRFTAASPLGSAGSATSHGGSFDLVLPARSATLAVLGRSVGGLGVDGPGGAEFSLAGVRPNPMAGEGTVSFALPQGGPSTLELFDAMGRRVWMRKLSLGPGNHVVGLRPGLVPGVYLVRLAQAGRVLTCRAAVVR